MPRRTFRFDAALGKLVEIHRVRSEFSVPGVIGDIQPFVSPIDGTVISSRSQLRDYMGERDLVLYDEAKTQQAHQDRYEAARKDTALRERLWEGLDRAHQGKRPGRSPPKGV